MSLFPILRGLLKVKLSIGLHVLVFSVTVMGEANLKVLTAEWELTGAGGTTKSNFGRDVSGNGILGRLSSSILSSSSSFSLDLIFPPCLPDFSSFSSNLRKIQLLLTLQINN